MRFTSLTRVSPQNQSEVGQLSQYEFLVEQRNVLYRNSSFEIHNGTVRSLCYDNYIPNEIICLSYHLDRRSNSSLHNSKVESSIMERSDTLSFTKLRPIALY